MGAADDLTRLSDALHGISTLYQFRSLNERTYSTLTVSQSYCLRILYFGGVRTMSGLAEELGVRLSTITGVIDQLEEKRLVERVDHPDDRRSLHVRLTAKGRQLYHTSYDAFLSHLKPLFDGRTPADREHVLAFLADVTDAIRGWRKHPRRKAPRHGPEHS